MAVYSDDVKRMIEKEIIRSTIGQRRFSPLPLFEQGAEYIIGSVRQKVLIASIAKETEQEEGVVQKVFSELLNHKRIAHIFALAAEVRLEKLAAEDDIPEIEQLYSFCCFLTEFIWYYPCVSDNERNEVPITILATSGKLETVYKKIPLTFTGFYLELAEFQKNIAKKITDLKEGIRGKILVDAQEGLSDDDMQEERLKLEKEMFAKNSLEVFHQFLKESEECFNIILAGRDGESYEKKALAKQLRDIQIIQNRLAEKVEKKEGASVSSIDREETEVLPIDKEKLLELLTKFFITTQSMSPEDAADEAKAALERAQQENINLNSSALLPPAPLIPNFIEPKQKNFALSLASVLKGVVLRKTNGSPEDAERLVNDFISSTGQINEAAVQNAKKRLTIVERTKLPMAIKYIPANSRDRDLNESEILHVLPLLPAGEELDRLDNGYILIGHEMPARARLYYLHKDKKEKVVECNRGDLSLLCDHVKKSLEDVTHLILDRKQQRDFIIAVCGGHNYKLAESALPVTVSAVSSLTQSSSSSNAPQQKSLLDDYAIVLLKDDKDWPEEAAMVDKTMYFKWDQSKNILAVKYRKEDGCIFDFERQITLPKNIKLVSEAFKQAGEITLTSEAKGFLHNFPANPIGPRMSVVFPKKGLAQSQKSDVPALSSDEKKKVEVVNEDMKVVEEKGEDIEVTSDSLNADSKLSSSPLSFLPLPSENGAKSSDIESSADAQLNSGEAKSSPGLK